MQNVLLVDDEAMVRIGVKTCVDWSGLQIGQVYEASNGAEALEIIRNRQVDIIITDIKMSVMDGFGMLEELKKMPQTPEVIVMSCYNDYENMRQAMAYGVKDFLFKPKMYPEDIEAAIRKLQGDMARRQKCLDLKMAEILQEITADTCQEQFRKLQELFAENTPELKEMVQGIVNFLNRLMELDDVSDPVLHIFSTALFRNMYEIRKCKKKAEILSIMKSVLKATEHEQSKKIKDELYRALRYIDLHLSDAGLCQELVAEHVELSVSYFCRFFKSEMGLSYSNYIIKKRIELAEELYRTTNMKVYEIAREVGYANERYFARLYKEHTGHTMKDLDRLEEKEQQ